MMPFQSAFLNTSQAKVYFPGKVTYLEMPNRKHSAINNIERIPSNNRYVNNIERIILQLTWSSIAAFTQRIPPGMERAAVEFEMVLKFLAEFTDIIKSSAPSMFINDQPSSLNPLIASLNPLQKSSEDFKIREKHK